MGLVSYKFDEIEQMKEMSNVEFNKKHKIMSMMSCFYWFFCGNQQKFEI
jgi:hypothetical protein